MPSAWRLLALLVAVAACASAERDDDRASRPLIWAAGEGDDAAVRELLAQGADVHQTSKDGESVLHVASIRGSLETARALLAAGAAPDARTPPGQTMYMTPSMWALYHGHAELVELLLEAGADPTAENEHGKSLLVMSQEAQQPVIEAMLKRYIERRLEQNG